MEKITQRAITYSLLAHVRGKGKLVGGPIDVFVPLIKMAISKLNEKGVFSGKNISEIKLVADEMFGVDFPNPVLRKILEKIAKEINTIEEKKIILFNDGAYQIKNYTFSEFEETIRVKRIEIDKLESLFKDFCATCNNPPSETSSIIAFIEKNKFGLSKYLANKNLESDKDYSNEAKFIEFFKIIPSVYNEIKKIYLGSILSSFLEYKTDNIKTNVELLLDTNFILGLIDLNTKESTHTCRKIVEIANAQGYKLKILQDTIIETVSLLKAKSSNFDTSFLQKSIYPEDIYNACERRKLNKADLERIADNLENELLRFFIYKIPETSKYRNQAKTSHEFKKLRKYRNTEQAALHDTTAIFYVREKRKKRIKDFENVNCWFVNNAISREKIEIDDSLGKDKDQFQPETIKADDFLNIIWLSNPQINISIDSDEISEIGLSTLISLTLNENLPRNEVIREIDDNIQKYAKDGVLSDSDIVRIATRITNRQISDLENLSKLAEQDSEAFIRRLNEEAKKQKEEDERRLKNMDKILSGLSKQNEEIEKLKVDLEKKSTAYDNKFVEIENEGKGKDVIISDLETRLRNEKAKRVFDENKRRKEKRTEYINKKTDKWRKKTWFEFSIWIAIFISGLLYVLIIGEWNLTNISANINELWKNVLISGLISILGAIFSGVTIKTLFYKYRNHSNIENYKKSIEIPEELNDVFEL